MLNLVAFLIGATHGFLINLVPRSFWRLGNSRLESLRGHNFLVAILVSQVIVLHRGRKFRCDHLALFLVDELVNSRDRFPEAECFELVKMLFYDVGPHLKVFIFVHEAI